MLGVHPFHATALFLGHQGSAGLSRATAPVVHLWMIRCQAFAVTHSLPGLMRPLRVVSCHLCIPSESEPKGMGLPGPTPVIGHANDGLRTSIRQQRTGGIGSHSVACSWLFLAKPSKAAGLSRATAPVVDPLAPPGFPIGQVVRSSRPRTRFRGL